MNEYTQLVKELRKHSTPGEPSWRAADTIEQMATDLRYFRDFYCRPHNKQEIEPPEPCRGFDGETWF